MAGSVSKWCTNQGSPLAPSGLVTRIQWIGEGGYDLATILPQGHGPLPDAFLEA